MTIEVKEIHVPEQKGKRVTGRDARFSFPEVILAAAVGLLLFLGWYLAQGSSFLQHRRGAFQNTDNPGTTDLIAWWALDDLSSPTTWVDSHSTGLDLTKNGSPTSDTGHVSGAVNVQPTGNYLANAAISTTFHQSDWSISVWFNIDATSDTVFALSQYGTTAPVRHWWLRYINTNPDTFGFMLENTSTTKFEATVDVDAIGAATWFHIVGVRSGNTLSIYLNGSKGTDDTFSGTENTGDPDLWIGRASNSYWNGLIDEVAIWTKALTQAEIDWLYNSGSGRAYSDL